MYEICSQPLECSSEYVKMPADGSCLFHALEYALLSGVVGYSVPRALDLRAAASSFVLEHTKELSKACCTSESELANHAHALYRDLGVYGELYDILAIACVFNATVYVHLVHESCWIVVKPLASLENFRTSRSPISLFLRLTANHYDAYRRD